MYLREIEALAVGQDGKRTKDEPLPTLGLRPAQSPANRKTVPAASPALSPNASFLALPRPHAAGQFLPVSLRPDTFPDRQFSAKQSFNYRTALP